MYEVLRAYGVCTVHKGTKTLPTTLSSDGTGAGVGVVPLFTGYGSPGTVAYK